MFLISTIFLFLYFRKYRQHIPVSTVTADSFIALFFYRKLSHFLSQLLAGKTSFASLIDAWKPWTEVFEGAERETVLSFPVHSPLCSCWWADKCCMGVTVQICLLILNSERTLFFFFSRAEGGPSLMYFLIIEIHNLLHNLKQYLTCHLFNLKFKKQCSARIYLGLASKMMFYSSVIH